MKTYSVATITKDVRVCLDEIGVNEAEFLMDSDSSDMDSVIASKIPDALRFVSLNASLEFLTPRTGEETVDSDSKGVVSCELPDDFLRLCYAQVEDWQFPVTSTILFTDKRYATLKNPITTGYPDNPKAAVVEHGQNRLLELYSTNKKGKSVGVKYGYIAEPKESEEYVVDEKIYRAVVYQAAGLTLMTFKDAHADSLFNMAIAMMK